MPTVFLVFLVRIAAPGFPPPSFYLFSSGYSSQDGKRKAVLNSQRAPRIVVSIRRSGSTHKTPADGQSRCAKGTRGTNAFWRPSCPDPSSTVGRRGSYLTY